MLKGVHVRLEPLQRDFIYAVAEKSGLSRSLVCALMIQEQINAENIIVDTAERLTALAEKSKRLKQRRARPRSRSQTRP